MPKTDQLRSASSAADKFYKEQLHSRARVRQLFEAEVGELVEKADRRTAWEFLQHMLEAIPYQVHTILTDNGIQSPSSRGTGTPSSRGRCAST